MSRKQAQGKLAQLSQQHRLKLGYTQAALAKRSNVSLGSLRKFEQTGEISLASYLKLQMALGQLDRLIETLDDNRPEFSNIEDVLNDTSKTNTRKRGWRE